jgi:WD40 repeat protein
VRGRSMGRLRHGVPIVISLATALACLGCGGGASIVQPPPTPQDFTITFSSSTLSLQQGSASASISVSVTGENGFTGTVQVTLGGLPSGVTTNPPSPFAVPAGTGAMVIFGATANAPTGSFMVSAQGTSGSLSHSANLALTVLQSSVSSLPRTSYIRTDSLAVLDAPPGEPHHRHVAYDPANKHVFTANRAMNRLEVLSSTDFSRVAQISVPAATSADLSADGATVWVGTALEEAVAVDTGSLQVKARYTIQALQPLPNTTFDRPEELLTLSNGKLMMRLRQSSTAEALLALWDPTSNTLTDLTSAAPQLFQSGVGPMARTGDHTKVLVAANDSSGQIALFDSNGNVIVGPQTLGNGTISFATANADGSRIAVVLTSNGTSQLFLLNGSLQQASAPVNIGVQGLTFSRDGSFLYVSDSSTTAPVITILDGHDLQEIGQVPDAAVQGGRSEIEEADETKLLFGIVNRGLTFIDAATPGALPSTVPALAAIPSAQPSEGPNTGGTSVLLDGANFESTAQVLFGGQPASNVSVANSNQIQATSPPSVANGTVKIAAYFPSGWLAIAPDAFSYGPQILRILPNAGTPSGGDTIQIYGYGFGSDPSKITVKIGGASSTVQKVENVTSIAASLGLDASYPFPIERITLQTPVGTAGKADVLVTSGAGSATSSKAFQYLQNEQFFMKPGFYRFLQYDQKRQVVYVSNNDHVDVLDLAAGQFRANGIEPPGGPPPNAGIRGMSLTPDGSQLVIADFGAQKVYLIDPNTGTGSAVAVGGVPGFTNSGPARVAATSSQTVFVGLSGEGGSSGGCSACLAQMDLSASPPTIEPAPQPEVSSLTGSPLVQGNAAGDHVFLSFASAPGGPLAAWVASAPNQFTTSSAIVSTVDLGTAADGTMFALQANGTTEIHGGDLSLDAVPIAAELAQIPGRMAVPGLTLHPSGALVYQPFLTGAPASSGVKGGVDIVDAHSGALRLRIFLPQQLLTDIDALHGDFLATDENGQRLFAIASSDGSVQNAGISVITLASVPLGIGTVSPPVGAAAGGTTLTIRGSGFQTGATVMIGGKAATVAFKDVNTLTVTTPPVAAGPQQMVIINPDGETVSLDAAFTAN